MPACTCSAGGTDVVALGSASACPGSSRLPIDVSLERRSRARRPADRLGGGKNGSAVCIVGDDGGRLSGGDGRYVGARGAVDGSGPASSPKGTNVAALCGSYGRWASDRRAPRRSRCGAATGRRGAIAGGGSVPGAGSVAIQSLSSAAARASSSARSSSAASPAACAARLSQTIASMRSPRFHKASAVWRPQTTSSASVSLVVGIATIARATRIPVPRRSRQKHRDRPVFRRRPRGCHPTASSGEHRRPLRSRSATVGLLLRRSRRRRRPGRRSRGFRPRPRGGPRGCRTPWRRCP